MSNEKSRSPGLAIRYYLKRNKLSQQEFAEKLDVSQSLVSQWVNGVAAVTPDNAKLIERVTGIPRLALLYPDEHAA